MSFEEVAVHLSSNNIPCVEKQLQTLTKDTCDINEENIDVIKRLLRYSDARILQLTAQVVAEHAKCEKNRNVLTDADLIQCLLKQLHTENIDLEQQTLRAIGNICFENEKGCLMVGGGGLQQILEAIKSYQSKKQENVICAGWGVLVNLLTTSEALVKASLRLNILDMIENALSHSEENNDSVIQQMLIVLNSVVDEIEETHQSQLKKLCYDVIKIMKTTSNLEIGALCLDFLFSQAESQQFRIIFAEEGICELIYELVEKYSLNVNSEEARSVLKMACDLIVIVLTEDDCMEMLYKEGEGTVYKNMLAWLDYDDTDLMTTAVLALGNFARKDSNCIQMVQNGLAKRLLDLLSKHNSTNGDIKVQHAILSTLKNLAIPKQNKRALLDDGLVDVVHPLLDTNHEIVIFKLLGTFRMVIDGQENAALRLITDQKLLERLMDWCYNSNHLGVRGEVPRLMAWLIKHCHSFQPIPIVLNVNKLLRCLVEMISSNHAIMQNEAYYALNILSLGSKDDSNRDFVRLSIEADIGKHLHYIIGKYTDKPDAKSTENLLCLLENLSKSPQLVEHLRLCGIREALLKLQSTCQYSEKLLLLMDRF